MKFLTFLTIIPLTLALAFVLALAWSASAQDGPLLPPQDPTMPVVTPPVAPSPSPTPSQPMETPAPSPTPTRPPSTPTATPTPQPEPSPPVEEPTATPPLDDSSDDPEPPVPPDDTDADGDDAGWDQAIWTPDGAQIGVVTNEVLNIRQAPSLTASIAGMTYRRHLVQVYERVAGDAVDGVSTWYRIGPGQYVSAAFVEPFVPSAPRAGYAGRWVDVNLSTFYAVAYDGDTPVYAAIIRTGRAGYETPTGEFSIFYRVENETMDAATLGVSPGDPEYYYVPAVRHTQYFAAGGYALHGNHWTDPSEFGTTGSHGCVNLLAADAAWFWAFLTTGSAVSIHY